LLEIRANDKNIKRYMDGHTFQLLSFILNNLNLKDKIKTEIIKAVNGM